MCDKNLARLTLQALAPCTCTIDQLSLSPSLPLSLYHLMVSLHSPPQEGVEATLYKEPYGVVGCITPWNFPLMQAVVKVGWIGLACGPHCYSCTRSLRQ